MRFDDRPFIAIWETTQACDLVCAHCRADAVPYRDPSELSTEEAQRLLDAFAAAGVPLVVLTGGDPAKRPDLVDLVRYGANLGLSMGLTPSATPLITPRLIEQLQGAGLSRLAISIDGPDARTHDGFRGRAGSFDRSLAILRFARELGLSTQVNTSVHVETIHALDAMAALVDDLEASLWSVFYLVPTGRAQVHMLPGAREVEASLWQLAGIAGAARFAIKTTAAPHYRRVVLQHKKATGEDVAVGTRGRQAMWVNDGRGMLFVSHRGDVFPSGFLPMWCGNVRHDDPIKVYRHHPLFRVLRDGEALDGKCGACEYRQVCGGSRARSFAMTRDVMGSDPLCAFVPAGYAGETEVWPGATPPRREIVMAG